MHKLKKSISTYALNDEKILQRMRRPTYFSFKLASALVLGFLMVLAILPHIQTQPTQAFVATLRVEINPAFEISVDHNDKVLDVIALNPEGEAFDETLYIGQSVATVVDALIAFAIEQGFIDDLALNSDVVSITLVVDEDERQAIQDAIDHLGQRLRAHFASLEGGNKVDIVFIKATLRELMEARAKNLPLGLFVLQGHLLLQDGTLIPMREFMKSEHGQHLNVLTRSQRQELRALERYLDRLSDLVEDLEDLESELLTNGSTDTQRLTELRLRIARLHERIATIQARVDELDDIKDGYSADKRARERLERLRERERERLERLREREEEQRELEREREEERREREELIREREREREEELRERDEALREREEELRERERDRDDD